MAKPRKGMYSTTPRTRKSAVGRMAYNLGQGIGFAGQNYQFYRNFTKMKTLSETPPHPSHFMKQLNHVQKLSRQIAMTENVLRMEVFAMRIIKEAKPTKQGKLEEAQDRQEFRERKAQLKQLKQQRAEAIKSLQAMFRMNFEKPKKD